NRRVFILSGPMCVFAPREWRVRSATAVRHEKPEDQRPRSVDVGARRAYKIRRDALPETQHGEHGGGEEEAVPHEHLRVVAERLGKGQRGQEEERDGELQEHDETVLQAAREPREPRALELRDEPCRYLALAELCDR